MLAALNFNLKDISIHAAREGGDAKVAFARSALPAISIHAAREGGDGGFENSDRR